MAKVTPSSGGNATVNVSSTAEQGRVVEQPSSLGRLRMDIQRNCKCRVNPYVDIADAASADKAGKIVTIAGK